VPAPVRPNAGGACTTGTASLARPGASLACCAFVPGPQPLTFRTIDPDAEGDIAYRHFAETSIASLGADAKLACRPDHLRWLRARVEEFPDGHVFALLGGQIVGQLELEIPYGKTVGYVNLFYVAKPFRRQGYGRAIHDYAERYVRAWEGRRIALDVSPDNRRAVGFYRHLGYRFTHIDGELARLWRMEKSLSAPVAKR
jgi:ribosomal protein S18 acetylase RimI-like enzyme